MKIAFHGAVRQVTGSMFLLEFEEDFRLLVDCGLAVKHQFGEKSALYEQALTYKHHDHLVCNQCSKIKEFSDPKIETPLIQLNQLIGLDLPFKVLCYAEPDTTEAKVAFTSAEFIQKRHNIGSEALRDYERAMNQIIEALPKKMILVDFIMMVMMHERCLAACWNPK